MYVCGCRIVTRWTVWTAATHFFSSPLHICHRCSTCHNTCRLFLHTPYNIFSACLFLTPISPALAFVYPSFSKKRSHVICKHTYTTHTHTHTHTKVRQQHQQQRYSQRQSLFLSSQQHTHLCRFTGWIERSWRRQRRRKKINTWKTPLGNSSVSRRENNLVRPCERKKKCTARFTEPKKKYTRFSPYISSLRTSQCHTASRNALWDEQARRYMTRQALPKFPLFLFFF